MATVNLGSIKFKWKGTYAGGTAYTIDDVVSYNGSSYICIQASTGNLPTNATYFEQMSSAGTNGANGANGANGTNGADGTDFGTILTTQGDLVYRDGSGIQRLGAGTNGQLLQSGGTGANPSWGTVDLTNLSATNLTSGTLPDARFPSALPAVSGANLTNLPGGSDFVKLGTVNITSPVSSLSIDGFYSADYEYYKVFISDVIQSYNNGEPLRMRFNISGVPNTGGYMTRISYASVNAVNAGSMVTTERKNTLQDFCELCENTGGTTGNCSIELNIPYPTKANGRNTFNSTYGGYNDTNIAVFQGQNAGLSFGAAAYTGVTIYPATNTIDSGRFTIYGVKH